MTAQAVILSDAWSSWADNQPLGRIPIIEYKGEVAVSFSVVMATQTPVSLYDAILTDIVRHMIEAGDVVGQER